MRHRVYYGDGSVSEAEPPPPLGVQAILQRNDEGQWHIRAGGDYYVLRGQEWIEVDIFGLFDYLMDTGLVLFGRTIANRQFAQVMAQAMKDREALDD